MTTASCCPIEKLVAPNTTPKTTTEHRLAAQARGGCTITYSCWVALISKPMAPCNNNMSNTFNSLFVSF